MQQVLCSKCYAINFMRQKVRPALERAEYRDRLPSQGYGADGNRSEHLFGNAAPCEFLRRPEKNRFSAVEHGYAVGKLRRLLQIVQRHEKGVSLPAEPLA